MTRQPGGPRGGEAAWEADARESYDRVAGAYEELTGPAVRENVQLREMYARLAEGSRAGLAPPPAVVDVGCGPGLWVAHLSSLGLDATGVDLSPAMIELARANAPGCRFEVGSVLDIPLPDTCADAVACAYVLHHVPDSDVDRALAELVRILRPGGMLLLAGHVGDDHRVKTEGYGGHPMRVLLNRRPAQFWAERLGAHGLVIEEHAVVEEDSPWHALYARRPGRVR